MLYSDVDIDFRRVSPTEFEELCFDLLLRLGYKGLTWRQGGADKGRDIEGRFTLNNPLVDSYEELWFFECKNYSKGVPPEQLYSKIAWADAEKPKHLVILTSSYLTDGCRQWLEAIRSERAYQIHVIEGKHLKGLIQCYPNLINRYFLDQFSRLLLDELQNWLIHDVLPQPETLRIYASRLDTKRLDVYELAFLWSSYIMRASEIEDWIEDDHEPFSLESLSRQLVDCVNIDRPILSIYEDFEHVTASAGRIRWHTVYSRCITAVLTIHPGSSCPVSALYCFVSDSEAEGLEVLIESTGDFKTAIRHVSVDARDEYSKILEMLFGTKIRESNSGMGAG